MTFLHLLLSGSLWVLIYGLVTGDVRALLFGPLAGLLLLGLINEVGLRRRNLASVEAMRKDRERPADWDWWHDHDSGRAA